MGTTYHVKFIPDTEENLQPEIEKLLIAINNKMSTYIKNSEISNFNQRIKNGTWEIISPEFFGVVEHALNLAAETNGAFDPTLGPLVNLWGFGPGGVRKIPSSKQIAMAKIKTGFNKIELDKTSKKIRKKNAGVYLDLSASAKGYGVDQIANLLEKKNISNYMVEIGGEIRTSGKKVKGPWKIAIEAPQPETKKPYQKILKLGKMALATSGDYRNFFKAGDQHFSHTINGKTGRPVAHSLASVSVLDPASCMNADALATALMAMGPEKGFAFAEARNIAAYFIYRKTLEGKVHFIDKATSLFTKWVNP
jgi:FAD:protein FMN transferase